MRAALRADGAWMSTGAEQRRGEQRLLTVPEVAEFMRVSNMTVYRLIRAGDLAATRVGRSYRIWENDVRSYLTRGTA